MTVPAAMNDPVRASGTTESQIVVSWSAPSGDSETGGSAITAYELLWDAGDGATPDTVLVALSSLSTSTSYTVTSGLTEGNDYIFMVRAQNIYGEGAYSNEVTITAASVPDAMDTVTTSVVAGEVKIVFTVPDDNGEAITGYDIEIMEIDGDFSEETTDCEGSDA